MDATDTFEPTYSPAQPSAPVDIPDPAAAEDATKNAPEFIHDPNAGKLFELWYNKYKCVQSEPYHIG